MSKWSCKNLGIKKQTSLIISGCIDRPLGFIDRDILNIIKHTGNDKITGRKNR
jgi:hypothetical protein